MFLRKRLHVKHEGQRRAIFQRYLGEVATAINEINGADREELLQRLMKVAQRRTTAADAQFDDRGRKVELSEIDFGGSVLIVGSETDQNLTTEANTTEG